MAIDAYVGLPGHGKSYGVTEHVIIPSIKEGRLVVTNIPMDRELLLADFGVPGSDLVQLPDDWFERDDLAELVPSGSVCVLDELWRRWPSGLKANDAKLSDKALLAEHRHRVDAKGRSMRVVLVSQDLSQLAAWVRILVEQTYKMTKLTAIGSTKKFRVDIYMGAPTGQNIPKSKLIRQTFGSYKPEVYRYYSSATQSATGNVGDESKADGRGNIWRSPFMIFSVVAPVILIPVLIYWLYGYFMSGFGMVEEKPSFVEAGPTNPLPPQLAHTQPVSPVERETVRQAQQQPSGPAMSTTWRVAGYGLRSSDKSRPAQAGWASNTGYGDAPGQQELSKTMPDVVILHSALAGIRNVPSSQCERLPDGFSWSCVIDGELVTPWTGYGANNSWADSGSLVTRTASVASGATAGDRPITNPAPSQL